MDSQEWGRLASLISKYIRDVTMDEDAQAHALSRIPDMPLPPSDWESGHDRWYIVQGKREALRYIWREERRGLQMRNGAQWSDFLELDSPMEVDGDLDTYHAVVPGHHGPDLWLEAFETVNELLQAQRQKQIEQAALMRRVRLLNRLTQKKEVVS